jgi:hypothetical protein
MKETSWSVIFTKAMSSEELVPSRAQELVGDDENQMYFAMEPLNIVKNSKNRPFYSLMEAFVLVVDNMWELFKDRGLVTQPIFNSDLNQMLSLVIGEKRFAIESWLPDKLTKGRQECVLVSLMRLAKYLLFFHDRLSLSTESFSSLRNGFTFDEHEEKFPMKVKYFRGMLEYLSKELKSSIKKLRKKGKKHIGLIALLKLNSIFSLFMNTDSASLRKEITGDDSWNRLSKVESNWLAYVASEDEELLLNNIGEYGILSRQGSDRNSDQSSEDSMSEAKDIYEREEDDMSDMDEMDNQLGLTEKSFKKNIQMNKRAQAEAQLNDQYLAVDDNVQKMGTVLGIYSRRNNETLMDAPVPKGVTSTIFEKREHLGKFGLSVETPELIKEELLFFADRSNILRDLGIEDQPKFRTHAFLRNTFGVIIEDINGDGGVKDSKEEIVIPLEVDNNLDVPNVTVEFDKIDLGMDSFEKFRIDLSTYQRDREKNLLKMKKIFEERERKEKESQEKVLNELEKRRGGWRANRQKKTNDGYQPPKAFVSNRVNLKRVVTFTPNLFKFFNKAEVPSQIESIPIEEVYENCIPDEEIFGKPFP